MLRPRRIAKSLKEGSLVKTCILLSVAIFCFVAMPLAAQEVRPEKAKEPGTKIAILNVRVVFEQYQRSIAMENELDKLAKPFQDKAKKLREEIARLQKELPSPRLDQKTKDRYEDAIRKSKYELEELSVEFRRIFSRKHEENLETLRKEVTMGADAVAKAYGFHLVLPVGEPDFSEPSLDRRRDANILRFGGFSEWGDTGRYRFAREPVKRDIRAPLYVHASIDITPVVVQSLNKWSTPDPQKKEETPAPAKPK